MNENISAIKLLVSLAAIFCQGILPSQGQKPCVEAGVEKKWSRISGRAVTKNGRFVMYWVENSSNPSLVLHSVTSGQKITIPNAGQAYFTQDNNKVIFKRNDSLGIITLEKEEESVKYLGDISTFSLINTGANTDILIYRLKQKPADLIIRDMRSGQERRYTNIDRYWVRPGQPVIVLETTEKEDSYKIYGLRQLTVGSDSLGLVWDGRRITDLLINEEGTECAFNVTMGDNNSGGSIWLCSFKEHRIKKIVVDDHASGIKEGYHIKGIIGFNGHDKRIFVNVEDKTTTSARVSSFVPLDVWSYKDAQLQSAQLLSSKRQSGYKAVINIESGKVIRLEDEDESVISPLSDDKPMRYVLGVKNGLGDLYNEWNWNPHASVSVYLLSLSDGKRRWIDSALPSSIVRNYILSYNENYVFYYDCRARNYYSYCTRDNHRKILRPSVHAHWEDKQWADMPGNSFVPYSIAGLIKDEDAILVYDQNDIYELNPQRKISAINLTEGSRQQGDIEIRLNIKLSNWFPTQLINRKEAIVCSAFDRRSKRQGFLLASIDSLGNVKKIDLQPFKYREEVIKARDTNIYLVSRMTASASPNVFLTTNFKTYHPITELYPERQYNWLKTELITWKPPGGTTDQGIVYLPEDFNPRKKYPLLVHYYERQSNSLYDFTSPGPSEGTLNIPFYVSHGYIVFMPDIYYTVGWPGKNALDAVVSGIRYLSARKYIDMHRIGLQGHSFGGFETNYIITHSHLFAAAMSASGMSDFISAYGSIIGDGTSRQSQYELYRDRMGATMWENPAAYLENSPVLQADKVTTPLLLLANKNDGDVPWQQGIEFFTALRRLGKKAWMLQYDDGDHMVEGKTAEDFSLRMFQFFNYYLKGEPPPVWMTRGIPARLKGIETGLRLDRSGEKP